MKKKLASVLYPAFLFAVPLLVGAQGINNLITDVGRIVNRLIPIVIGLGVLMFIIGILRYLFAKDDVSKADSRNFMLWGIIALFVMVSVWGLVSILQTTLFGGVPTDRPPSTPTFPAR